MGRRYQEEDTVKLNNNWCRSFQKEEYLRLVKKIGSPRGP